MKVCIVHNPTILNQITYHLHTSIYTQTNTVHKQSNIKHHLSHSFGSSEVLTQTKVCS